MLIRLYRSPYRNNKNKISVTRPYNDFYCINYYDDLIRLHQGKMINLSNLITLITI